MYVPSQFFLCVRRIIRFFSANMTVPKIGALPEPAVFVCRHKNMQGPMQSMIWMDIPVRPWIFSVFCDKETCFKQFSTYTLTKYLGWPAFVALPTSRLFSCLVPGCMRKVGAIPVYRKSAEVRKTYSKTIEALEDGANIIIFPDVDYTSTSDKIGEMYDGYLLLHRLYKRKTGKNLPFIPLYVDKKGHRIINADPVYFADNADYNLEKDRVSSAIAKALDELAEK